MENKWHPHAWCSFRINRPTPIPDLDAEPSNATLRQALISRAGSASTTIVCRANLFQCLTPTVDRLLAGEQVATMEPLFLTQCNCSNKCSILVNHPASQATLNAMERANWGVHLIEGKTTALGLLLYGKISRCQQGWEPVEELSGTQALNPKAMLKANHRLALFSTPAHSVVQ